MAFVFLFSLSMAQRNVDSSTHGLPCLNAGGLRVGAGGQGKLGPRTSDRVVLTRVGSHRLSVIPAARVLLLTHTVPWAPLRTGFIVVHHKASPRV
jgi:hypothetical protein